MSQKRNEILGAIHTTAVEIQEMLAKSGYGAAPMAKDDHAEGDEPPMGGEGGGEMPPPAPEGGGDEGGMPPPAPGGEGGDMGGDQDPGAALAEQAKQLSDEELDHMIEALMSEKEARAGAGGEGGGMPPPAPGGEGGGEAPPAPAPAEEEPAPAEKSMKSEFASLAKSMTAMAGAITTLTAQVKDLKTAPKPVAKVTAKPAAANVANAQVLHKSTPAKKRLNKSETMDFAQGEIRKGSKLFDRHVVAEINLAKSDAELAAIQDRLEIDGVKFPDRR